MVRDTDNGYAALLARCFDLEEDPTITVGVHEADAKVKHDGNADESITVADVAAFHEFGLGNNPRRSFIGDYFDLEAPQINAWASSAMKRFLGGQGDRDQILARVGIQIVGGIQQRMAQGIDPSLAHETIARKGSSTPLIDTGQLRSSITWKAK